MQWYRAYLDTAVPGRDVRPVVTVAEALNGENAVPLDPVLKWQVLETRALFRLFGVEVSTYVLRVVRQSRTVKVQAVQSCTDAELHTGPIRGLRVHVLPHVESKAKAEPAELRHAADSWFRGTLEGNPGDEFPTRLRVTKSLERRGDDGHEFMTQATVEYPIVDWGVPSQIGGESAVVLLRVQNPVDRSVGDAWVLHRGARDSVFPVVAFMPFVDGVGGYDVAGPLGVLASAAPIAGFSNPLVDGLGDAETVYYTSGDPAFATVDEWIAKGLDVYNAARPLRATIGREGRLAIEGPSLVGVFYVALDPTDPDHEALAARNRELGGVPVTRVTREMVLDAIKRRFDEKYPQNPVYQQALDEASNAGHGRVSAIVRFAAKSIPEIARDLDLPWFMEWSPVEQVGDQHQTESVPGIEFRTKFALDQEDLEAIILPLYANDQNPPRNATALDETVRTTLHNRGEAGVARLRRALTYRRSLPTAQQMSGEVQDFLTRVAPGVCTGRERMTVVESLTLRYRELVAAAITILRQGKRPAAREDFLVELEANIHERGVSAVIGYAVRSEIIEHLDSPLAQRDALFRDLLFDAESLVQRLFPEVLMDRTFV